MTPYGPPSPDDLSYYPYQAKGIMLMRPLQNIYLADEMGLGKTVQAIGLINDDPTIVRVLIVCPAGLRPNWEDELGRWLVRDLLYGSVYGKRESGWVPNLDIVIISYAILSAHKRNVQAPWDLVICDEAHMLKTLHAKRTQAVRRLLARRRLFMSGTPILSRPMDLYAVLFSMYPTFWGGRHEFGVKYCGAREVRREIRGRWKTEWDYSGASNLPELAKRLSVGGMIRRLKRDHLKELPPKTNTLVRLELKAPKWLQEFTAKLDAKVGGGDYVTEVARMALPDSPLFHEIATVRAELGEVKAPAAIEWIRAKLPAVDKLLVFAHHHTVLDALEEAFAPIGALRVDGRTPAARRTQRLHAFQTDPTVRMLIGGTHAVGVGHTLTACSHAVFVEPDWNPSVIAQASDRLHRIGQDKPVNIYHLVVDDSLDSRMSKGLVAKSKITYAALPTQ